MGLSRNKYKECVCVHASRVTPLCALELISSRSSMAQRNKLYKAFATPLSPVTKIRSVLVLAIHM